MILIRAVLAPITSVRAVAIRLRRVPPPTFNDAWRLARVTAHPDELVYYLCKIRVGAVTGSPSLRVVRERNDNH